MRFAVLASWFFAYLAVAATAAEKPAEVETIIATPLKRGNPYSPFVAERIQFADGQRYSKWSVVFREARIVESVAVSVCGDGKTADENKFVDGVELFLDFDRQRFFIDGGKRTIEFKVNASARALTLLFNENTGLCLSRIQLGVRGGVRPPTVLAATVDGDSRIIDGALAGGGRLDDAATPASTRIDFLKTDLTVHGLRLWNGNQGPGNVFTSGGRAREIEIKIDGQLVKKAVLEDRRYDQVVEFSPTSLKRDLAVTVVSGYPGTVSTAPVIGELRLLGKDGVIAPVDRGVLKVASDVSGAAAEQLERILDHELRVDEKGDVWRFRFRSDGTFFARVFLDRVRSAREWSVLGHWTPVVSAPKTKASGARFLKLRLVGMQLAGPMLADSLPCAILCFDEQTGRTPASRGTDERQKPVDDVVEVQPDGPSHFFIRNRTIGNQRTLPFRDLKVRIHSLYE